MPGREVPEIADADVSTKLVALRIDGRYACGPVEHVSPFGGLCANAAHARRRRVRRMIDARDGRRDPQLPHGHLPRPPPDRVMTWASENEKRSSEAFRYRSAAGMSRSGSGDPSRDCEDRDRCRHGRDGAAAAIASFAHRPRRRSRVLPLWHQHISTVKSSCISSQRECRLLGPSERLRRAGPFTQQTCVNRHYV